MEGDDLLEERVPRDEIPHGDVPHGDVTGEIALDVQGLRHCFKDHVAVDGISFTVPAGAIHGG